MKKSILIQKRRQTRLNGYDYGTFGAYFITICVKDKKLLLPEITGRNVNFEMEIRLLL